MRQWFLLVLMLRRPAQRESMRDNLYGNPTLFSTVDLGSLNLSRRDQKTWSIKGEVSQRWEIVEEENKTKGPIPYPEMQ